VRPRHDGPRTLCADIVGGAVLLGLWLGEHLAVAIPVFVGVSATPGGRAWHRYAPGSRAMSKAEAIILACAGGAVLGVVIGALIPKSRIKDWRLVPCRSRSGGHD